MSETTPETSVQTRRLALEDWHERAGARFAEVEGSRLPLDYGDPSGELVSAREGLALADVSDLGRVELVGEDRVRFLSGLVTCDVAALEPGQGAYGFFTTPQGRILSDVVVLCHADRLWLELPRGRGRTVREHLAKYIVADRVEVRSLADVLTFRLVGEGLPSWLAAQSAGLPSGPFGHAAVTVDGTDVHVASTPFLGVPAATLWVSSGIAEPVWQDLVDRGARPAGHGTLEALRVAAGVPRFGPDFDDGNLPQETRIDGAVSYDKGCYLGQEIVARLHYRGQPAREVRRVRGAGDAPTVPIDLAESAGSLSSAVSLGAEGWVGLALVARRALDEPSLETSAGAAMDVGEPPPSFG